MMSLLMEPFEQSAHQIVKAIIRLKRTLPDAVQLEAIALAIYPDKATTEARTRLRIALLVELAARKDELPWRE